MEGKKCGCPHHKMVPLFIVLIGVTFLLQAGGYIGAEMVAVIWPVLLILIGLMKMMNGACKCCSRGM